MSRRNKGNIVFIFCYVMMSMFKPSLGNSVPTSIPGEHDGLYGIYGVVKYFLTSIVQPLTIETMTSRIDASSQQTLMDSFTSNWKEWVTYFTGYVVSVSIGVVYAVTMTITGLCFFCCRRSGKCGSKVKRSQRKHGKCVRISCSVSLLIISLILATAVTFALLAGIVIFRQINDSNAVSTITENMSNMDTFLLTTADQIEAIHIHKTITALDLFNTRISSIASTAKERLLNGTKTEPAMSNLQRIPSQIERLHYHMLLARILTSDLRNHALKLSLDLSVARTQITMDLSQCVPAVDACNQVAKDIDLLMPNVGYSNLEDLTPAINAISNVLSNGLETDIVRSQNIIDNIDALIRERKQIPVNQSMTALHKFKDTLGLFCNKYAAHVRAINVSNVVTFLTENKTQISGYSVVVFSLFTTFLCLLYVISVVNYIGVFLNCCCKKPCQGTGDHKRQISTTIAGRFLLTGVTLAFVSSGILMLMTSFLFLAGGISYTEICRHLEKPSHSTSFVAFDAFVSTSLGVPFSVSNSIRRCENNDALFTAFELERYGLNITMIADTRQYKVDSSLEVIKLEDVSLNDVTILNATLTSSLYTIDKTLDNINLQSYYAENAKEFTKFDINNFATGLENAAEAVKGRNMSAILSTNLNLHAYTLRQITTSTIATMALLRSNLSTSLSEVERIKNEVRINETVQRLQTAQSLIKANGSELVNSAVKSEVDDILLDLREFTVAFKNIITNDVGRCRTLHNTLNATTHTCCVVLLNPLNALWFCLGWALVFLIPIVILAICLNNDYRRKFPVGVIQNQTIGEGNLDQETRPNDVINVRQVQNSNVTTDPEQTSSIIRKRAGEQTNAQTHRSGDDSEC